LYFQNKPKSLDSDVLEPNFSCSRREQKVAVLRALDGFAVGLQLALHRRGKAQAKAFGRSGEKKGEKKSEG